MPILFCAVARDKVILDKFATCDGNFEEIVQEVILKIPDINNKMTYSHGRYLLHYINEERCFYFCITDRTCQRSRAFLFLNEIKRQHENIKGNFTNILAQEMYRYNEGYETIAIRRGELEEVNCIGVDSSENLLGEKLLLIKSDQNLRYTTISFANTTPQNVTVFVQNKKFDYLILITVFVFGLSTIFLFTSPSYAIIVIIFLLYFLKRKY